MAFREMTDKPEFQHIPTDRERELSLYKAALRHGPLPPSCQVPSGDQMSWHHREKFLTFSGKHCTHLEQRMWLLRSKHNTEITNTTPSYAKNWGCQECPYSGNKCHTHGPRQEVERSQILPFLSSIVLYKTIGYEKEIKHCMIGKEKGKQ